MTSRAAPASFAAVHASSSMLANLLRGPPQRHLGHYQRPGSWPAANFELAAQQRDSLSHAGDAYPLTQAPTGWGSFFPKASPPVPDPQTNFLPQAPEFEAYPAGTRVLAHVRQRLLR